MQTVPKDLVSSTSRMTSHRPDDTVPHYTLPESTCLERRSMGTRPIKRRPVDVKSGQRPHPALPYGLAFPCDGRFPHGRWPVLINPNVVSRTDKSAKLL